MTPRTIANRLLEAEEDLDLPGDLSRYTQSPIPGIEVEAEGRHWNVYKLYSLAAHIPPDLRGFIGEITYDSMEDMPVENMTPENIAYWNAHRWMASAGFRDEERQMCKTFEAALQFIVAVNAIKTSPVRESEDEEPPLNAAAEVERYTAPVGITVQNQGTFDPIHKHRSALGRKFYVELTWNNEHTHANRIQPLVTFFDATYGNTPEWPKGQQVSAYEAADLARHTGALDLYGDEPAWKVDAEAMQQVSQWLRDELETKRGYRLRPGFWGTYEALDPDAPELYLKPEQFTAQPDYEKRESDLRIMLRPYYGEVRINRRPAKFADIFKGLPEYFTWTIHCKRNESLKLPTHDDRRDRYIGVASIDWRKQVRSWFEKWAQDSNIRLDHFEIFGRLRKNPTFQFDTHLPWKPGTGLTSGKPLKETAEDEDMTPEQIISDLLPKLDWHKDIEQALWQFHPFGVSYTVVAAPNCAFILANCYFPPEKDNFAGRLRDFVVDWLTQHRILVVQSSKVYTFKHVGASPQEQKHMENYPRWTAGVSVNSNWPPDMPEYVPPPVEVGQP